MGSITDCKHCLLFIALLTHSDFSLFCIREQVLLWPNQSFVRLYKLWRRYSIFTYIIEEIEMQMENQHFVSQSIIFQNIGCATPVFTNIADVETL